MSQSWQCFSMQLLLTVCMRTLTSSARKPSEWKYLVTVVVSRASLQAKLEKIDVSGTHDVNESDGRWQGLQQECISKMQAGPWNTASRGPAVLKWLQGERATRCCQGLVQEVPVWVDVIR